jgi:uncharacterized protein (TIGR03086 family)
MTTSTNSSVDLLAAVLDDLATVTGAITPGQLHDPTPCAEFDVGQLREHVVGWLDTFAAGFADPDGRAPRASLDGYQMPTDAAGAVRAASGTLIGALRGDAASRPLWLGDSAMPGELALGLILWEYQMHGWDLARATGQPWSPPAAAVGESLVFAPGMLTDDYQGAGKPFAPAVAVPESAPAFDQLLGLSGRDPGWQRNGAARSPDSAAPAPAATSPAPLIARFRVDGAEPQQIPGVDGGWAGMMIFSKTFTSGITGSATTVFMSAGTQEGKRSYVATERITGRTDDGREGTLIVQHGGLESDPATWFGHIVPEAGHGDFASWSWSARIIHDDEGAYFEIRLS